jgi:hypothetical protein
MHATCAHLHCPAVRPSARSAACESGGGAGSKVRPIGCLCAYRHTTTAADTVPAVPDHNAMAGATVLLYMLQQGHASDGTHTMQRRVPASNQMDVRSSVGPISSCACMHALVSGGEGVRRTRSAAKGVKGRIMRACTCACT